MHLPEQILTQRLRLQAMRVAHAEVLFRLMNAEYERLLNTMGGPRKNMNVAEQAERLAELETKRENGKEFPYCIFLTQPGQPDVLAGTIGVHHVLASNCRGEFGYWLGAEFEGHGIMSEAVTAMEQACWDAGFHHLQIRCASHNARSAAVPQRLGYTLDGRIREAWLHLDQWHDELVFTKLAGE